MATENLIIKTLFGDGAVKVLGGIRAREIHKGPAADQVGDLADLDPIGEAGKRPASLNAIDLIRVSRYGDIGETVCVKEN